MLWFARVCPNWVQWLSDGVGSKGSEALCCKGAPATSVDYARAERSEGLTSALARSFLNSGMNALPSPEDYQPGIESSGLAGEHGGGGGGRVAMATNSYASDHRSSASSESCNSIGSSLVIFLLCCVSLDMMWVLPECPTELYLVWHYQIFLSFPSAQAKRLPYLSENSVR